MEGCYTSLNPNGSQNNEVPKSKMSGPLFMDKIDFGVGTKRGLQSQIVKPTAPQETLI